MGFRLRKVPSTKKKLEFFSTVDDLNMAQLTQKMKKSEKNAKNALTSHYANGHGDPCDKWVKNHTTVYVIDHNKH